MKSKRTSFDYIQGKLNKAEMKKIKGGLAMVEDGGPCDSCWGSGGSLAHHHDSGSNHWGMCPADVGGTSCHNYCVTSGGGTYWC